MFPKSFTFKYFGVEIDIYYVSGEDQNYKNNNRNSTLDGAGDQSKDNGTARG